MGGEGKGVSDDRAELLAGIKAKAVIRGDFVLSSGRRADVYVDLRRVLLDGRLAPLAGRVMLDLTADLAYEIAMTYAAQELSLQPDRART